MIDYWQIYPYTVIGFLSLGLITALANHFFIHRLGNATKPGVYPFVSVLVPARNEASNIESCLRSLLEQDYPQFEVIVLNDHSTDDTGMILKRLQAENNSLRSLDGVTMPQDWLGKHWACHQLAELASGELLLFTDADTRHHPNMIEETVSLLLEKNADFLTAFPKEEMLTWGEMLTVPILGFSLFSFLPFMLADWLKIPELSVSFGQLMLIRKKTYKGIGGYEAIRSHPVDDVKLGRQVIKHGYKWLLADGTQYVTCRMYSGFQSALEGFTKNLFAFFGYRTILYLVAWIWMGIVFLQPPIILLLQAYGIQTGSFTPHLAVITITESFLLFALASYRFRTPFYLAILYPISILLFVLIALRSLFMTTTGRNIWKDRKLPRSYIHW